jgi:hypothetical protein
MSLSKATLQSLAADPKTASKSLLVSSALSLLPKPMLLAAARSAPSPSRRLKDVQ